MKRFISPELEVSHFDLEDVIATSGGENPGSGDNDLPFSPA